MRAITLILGLMLGFAGLSVPVFADAPEIPKATGEPHPEGNDWWRRWHMEQMKHDRDETMYEGKRDVSGSLTECFECHTVKDEAGTPVTYEDERHFCRTCHDYVAVKVDCFMCHRSTPDGFEEPPLHAVLGQQTGEPGLESYLNDVAMIGEGAQ